ncbi:MAG: YkgJ family cysteine cluster protein [Deltaproteobacteria bacterium]|nr:YkgJ family cysteine cluster protein [Deltaproteobacteria bacterium]MBW1970439.1 YkgJ family cysteine cluster protein [Deltaproteobacteria bacterium]MBW2156206.1 YkgJ family cysteine cluster protein [Deltaproteobacteria bacterium]MBW2227891.1 YkgJ family cysteine cluster protein [Deltaproteobacteria bacterium]MBW2327930.1 YkgJ family cysteine cluster protein [Deltaproteobacteria bacterium]
MENNISPLLSNDTFKFSCTQKISCFNECCRDLNQFLTPYDILRLKNQLGLTSSIFLERYTTRHTGPETGLPIITLKTDSAHEFKCPFVTASGCRVYEDRPSSCRMYPLIRVASRSRETGTVTEQYMLLKEAHCLGCKQGHQWTVRKWIENQEVAIYNQMNDMFMEIIGLKNRLLPGPLDIKSGLMFHWACYDLDTFRSHIFDKDLLGGWNLDPKTPYALKHDDIELLQFGFKWVKETLFGKP